MLSEPAGNALIFGCGYLGFPVALSLLREGWRVSTLTRSESRARELATWGIEALVGDWTSPHLPRSFPPVSRVLVAVGHDSATGKSRHQTYVEGLQRVLPRVNPESDWIYISSTGVYHQGGGVWVDETSSTRPQSEGGRALLAAEQLLWRARRGGAGKTVVLRMAGLYGPGRVPRLREMKAGEPFAATPGYLNLIHQTDAVAAIMAAWACGSPRETYVIADGVPVERADFYREVARRAGMREVRFVAGTGGRSEGSKRVWPARMRRDLLRTLAMPSFREGLGACGLCPQSRKA